jgi:hypothetical protein
MALMVIAGCGDDGIVGPAEELTGVWVRHEATAAVGIRVALPDSLVIARDGSARWSRDATDCCGGPPYQLDFPMTLECREAGVFVALDLAPCPHCQSAAIHAAPSSPRANQIADHEVRLVQRGQDALELYPVEGEPPEHYFRTRSRDDRY